MSSISGEGRQAGDAAPDPEGVLASALAAVSEAFQHPQLSCDPAITGPRPKLVEAVETFRRDVLTNVHAIVTHLSPSEQRRMSEGIAQLAERLVGVLLLSGSGPTASQLIGETLGCLPPGSALDELTAAAKDPDAYAQLSLARWFWLQGYAGKARKHAEKARRSKEPSLVAAAKRVLMDPQPIKSAPPLFTINGFGLKMYGQAERRPDGFYASTLYLCGLFIPLLPISRYLVRDAGDGSWQFRGKLPLSLPQRWYRRLLLVGILALIGWGQVQKWLTSPGRLAGNEIADVQKKVEGLAPEKAAIEWHRVLSRWGGQAPAGVMAPVVEAWLPLELQTQVKEPFTRAQLPVLDKLVRRFLAIDARTRERAANGTMAAKLAVYAQALDGATAEELEAKKQVLELADKVSPGSGAAELTATRHALAALVADTWPMRAVEQYAQGGAGDVEGLARAAALLDGLEGAGTLFVDEGPSVRAWQSGARYEKSLADAFARSEKRVEEAKALLGAPGRAELLQSHDEKQLAAAIEKRPGDQALVVALAKLLRERGDVAGATRALEKLGPPGRMIGEAQLFSAYLLLDAGKVDEAETRLSDFLATRRARFVKARTELEQREKTLQQQLIARAKAGNLPRDLDTKMSGQTEEKQGELFREWLQEEMGKDAQLATFSAEYQSLSPVVEASITLGTLQLQRAGRSSGEERAALLDDAEQSFLSVNVEAEGSAEYQMGLGQVFHRLGKAKEGDAQLMGLANRSDATMKTAVAAVYRSLGLVTQGRALLQPLYDAGVQPHADDAARLMANMATSLDDNELWLGRIKHPTPSDRANLNEVAGQRLMMQGKVVEADAEFAKAQAHYAKTAAQSSASANNAALASVYRFEATGDVAHLDRAITYYQSAMRQLRDNPIILQNVAHAQLGRMSVALIEKWVSMKRLKLKASEALVVLRALFSGPLEADVRKAVETSPGFREAMELAQQQQVLAPNDPSSYTQSLLWLGMLENERAMTELEERIERVKKFDSAQAEDALARARAGSQLEQEKAAATSRLAVLDGLMPVAATGAERGAVSYLRCRMLEELGGLEQSIERYQQSAAACRSAHEQWPALNLEGAASSRLANVGVLEVAARLPRLKERLAAEQWKEHPLFTAWALAKSDPEVASALAASKTLQDANRAGLAVDPKHLDPDAWEVAMLVRDAAGAKKAAQHVDRKKYERWVRISERLAPGTPSVHAVKTLLEAMGPVEK